MVNHPNRSKHDFFLYKTPGGLSGVLRLSEVARVEEINTEGAILRVFMKDGTVIESNTYDLSGFAAQILGDDVMEELIQAVD